ALRTVDIDPKLSIRRATCRGHVVPAAVGDINQAADGLASAFGGNAEGDAAATQRNAVFAVVRSAGDATIDDHVAEAPAILARLTGRATVPARLRLHPELDGEVAPDIHGSLRVDRHFHAVDIAHRGALKPQREAHRGAGRRAGRSGVGSSRRGACRAGGGGGAGAGVAGRDGRGRGACRALGACGCTESQAHQQDRVDDIPAQDAALSTRPPPETTTWGPTAPDGASPASSTCPTSSASP